MSLRPRLDTVPCASLGNTRAVYLLLFLASSPNLITHAPGKQLLAHFCRKPVLCFDAAEGLPIPGYVAQISVTTAPHMCAELRQSLTTLGWLTCWETTDSCSALTRADWLPS